MKKLLFITPELPYPPQSGGKVKSMKLVQALAERYEVTYVSPLKLEDPQYFDAFAAASPCKEHFVAPLDIPRSAGNLLRSYLNGQPLNVKRSFDRQLAEKVAAMADQFDLIFLDHYEVFPYLPDNYRGTVVYHAHNAYFKIWQRYASLPGNPALRLAALLESRRVRNYEARVAGRADLVFAAPNDARELVASGIRPDKLRDTYHLGDDAQLDLPELDYGDTRKKLMYVGFLGWEPNVQGLLWFIDQVWPTLAKRHPDLSFDIVGKNPDKRLREAVEGQRGISLTGYVADLDEVYRDSRVSVAPLLFGSGMKVKVLDAMARGIPIVTTNVGAEGIDVVDGEHLRIADTPCEMVAAIDRLLSDPGEWRSLQLASRRLIRERYTWRQLFNAMHRDIDNTLKAHRPLAGDYLGELSHAG